MKIDVENIKTIEIPDGGNLQFKFEDGNLIIDSPIDGYLVDGNFREIEKRFADVEKKVNDVDSQLKMRVFGELARFRGEIERLKRS